MDYYLWSKPQNKPFFETRHKQRTCLAIVGRQKSSPGGVGFRTKDKAPEGLVNQLTAGLSRHCDLLCGFDTFSSDGEDCNSRLSSP